jgi:hypothetical protein
MHNGCSAGPHNIKIIYNGSAPIQYVFLTKHYQGNKIQQDKMDKASCMYWTVKISIQCFSQKTEGKKPPGRPGI